MHQRHRVPPADQLTAADLARLGIPAATVRDWRRRGRLQAVGGTERYPRYRATDVLPLVQAWQTRRGRAA
ncbi:hypothetical protein [Kitasatospora sp. NPDC058046]|uniref:hypothetical protein n=1 Tax=Kitasatospora sp. NPDC058046 TaxID=3346312 RepID=UPI0036DBCF22